MATNETTQMADTDKPKLNIKDLLDKLKGYLLVAKRYGVLIFVVFVAGLYGFVVFRVSTLNNTQPTTDAVSAQVKAAQIPHIDQNVVKQLQSLQDNSVNVKALFNQERSNPFQ